MSLEHTFPLLGAVLGFVVPAAALRYFDIPSAPEEFIGVLFIPTGAIAYCAARLVMPNKIEAIRKLFDVWLNKSMLNATLLTFLVVLIINIMSYLAFLATLMMNDWVKIIFGLLFGGVSLVSLMYLTTANHDNSA